VLAAVAAIAPNLDLAAFARDHHNRLPCDRCRGAEDAARRLPKTRLGVHGRTILTAAAATDDDNGVAVVPQGTPHSRAVILNRAARRLWDSGLVGMWRGRDDRRRVYHVEKFNVEEMAMYEYTWEMTAEHRVNRVRLTPFGAALVARYRDALEMGGVIRWDERVQDALIAVRQPTDALVARLARDVEGIVGDWRRWQQNGVAAFWGWDDRDAIARATTFLTAISDTEGTAP
jgi:hypothetical protein